VNVQNILDELTSFGFEDIADTEKVRIVNEVIGDVCSREPWPFLTKESSAATVDAAGKIGGIADLGSVLFIVDTTTGMKLRWMRWDEFTQRYALQLTLTGDPYLYFFKGPDLYVYPIDATPTLRVGYVKLPATVVQADAEAAIAIPPRHHWIIVEGCLVKLFAIDDDLENASAHKNAYDERLMTMRQDMFKQQWDTPDSIGVFEDDYNDDSGSYF
jgi:hypothetical protein